MTKDLTIQILRDAVKNKTYIEQEFRDMKFYGFNDEDAEIENIKTPTKGVIIDMNTANVLVNVYDAMKDETNKHKFENMLRSWFDFEKLVTFAWRYVK